VLGELRHGKDEDQVEEQLEGRHMLLVSPRARSRPPRSETYTIHPMQNRGSDHFRSWLRLPTRLADQAVCARRSCIEQPGPGALAVLWRMVRQGRIVSDPNTAAGWSRRAGAGKSLLHDV
jgi:hypothetical protein